MYKTTINKVEVFGAYNELVKLINLTGLIGHQINRVLTNKN